MTTFEDKKCIADLVRMLEKVIGCELILTGSLALEFHGFDMECKVNDVDLIMITPTLNQIQTLQFFELLSPISHPVSKRDSYGKLRNHVEVISQFSFAGLKIDLFNEPQPEDEMLRTYVIIGGIKVKKIPLIIEAKKRFNRKKDWEQIKQLQKCMLP